MKCVFSIKESNFNGKRVKIFKFAYDEGRGGWPPSFTVSLTIKYPFLRLPWVSFLVLVKWFLVVFSLVFYSIFAYSINCIAFEKFWQIVMNLRDAKKRFPRLILKAVARDICNILQFQPDNSSHEVFLIGPLVSRLAPRPLKWLQYLATRLKSIFRLEVI